MARLLTRLKRIATAVSNQPSYESYSWGPRRSSVAIFLYQCIFLLRLISPLQWWKFNRRLRSARSQLHSSMEIKDRPDFHAADSEHYMLLVLALSLAVYGLLHAPYSMLKDPIFHWPASVRAAGLFLLWLFLVESVQWTFYYTLFRPLMDRGKLNLYDEAEYFVMLPVVIVTQLFLVSILWGTEVGRTGLLLLNIGDLQPAVHTALQSIGEPPAISRAQSITAALLGQSYIVIVIANLIRIVPALHVRKRPNITVIGYGDVTKARILGALLKVYEPRQIAVASEYLSNQDRAELHELQIGSIFSAYDDPTKPLPRAEVVTKISQWAGAHSRYAIIAVPTFAHMDYMLQLFRRGMRFGVEKPIVGTEAELDLLSERSSAELFENAFVFSYYWLEKGLSLNYLLTLNPNYLPLLDAHPDWSMQEIELQVSRLGPLQEIAIEFLEGHETEQRYWTELMANGGMVFETLVHPLTFVLHLWRKSQKGSKDFEQLWSSDPTIRWFRNTSEAQAVKKAHNQEIGPTFVEIEGVLTGGARLSLRCGKYMAPDKTPSRYLIATYANGSMTTDLSEMETRLFRRAGWRQELVLTLSNKKIVPSQGKRAAEDDDSVRYQHQIDMLNTFFLDGWGGLRFDDYPSQLGVLRLLLTLSRSIPAESSIEGDEVIEHAPWMDQSMMADPTGFLAGGDATWPARLHPLQKAPQQNSQKPAI